MKLLKISFFLLFTILCTNFLLVGASAQQAAIPAWVKNNAKWWAAQQLSDSDFIKGIQYMIQQGIIKIPQTKAVPTSHGIPKWVKNSAKFWADGRIGDSEFVKGIQYLIAVGIIQVPGQQAPPSIPSQPTQSTKNLSMIFPLFGTSVQQEATIFGPYLRAGDTIAVHQSDTSFNIATQLKAQVPGILVQTGGVSKGSIISLIPQLPSVVDTIGYDYEPNQGNTPEFTTDQTQSIQNFDQILQVAHQYGKKLMIEPVYIRSPGWDWGEVAKHTDILLVQMQNFQTGATGLPSEFSPQNMGIDLLGATNQIVSEVHAKSPSTKIYIQLGFKYSPDPNNIIKDINTIKNTGIDGIIVMQQAVPNGDSLLLQVLQSIRATGSS